MKKTNSETSPFDAFDFARLSDTGERTMAALTQANARFFEIAARTNGEFLDFTRRRLQRDMEVSQKFAACRSVPETLDACQAFYRDAWTDYSDEMGRLMKVAADVSQVAGAGAVADAAPSRPAGDTGKGAAA